MYSNDPRNQNYRGQKCPTCGERLPFLFDKQCSACNADELKRRREEVKRLTAERDRLKDEINYLNGKFSLMKDERDYYRIKYINLSEKIAEITGI